MVCLSLCGCTMTLVFFMPLNCPNILLWCVVVCFLLKRSGPVGLKTRILSRPSKVSVPPSLLEAVGGSAQPMWPFSFFGSAVVEVAKESVQAKRKEVGRVPAAREKTPQNKGARREAGEKKPQNKGARREAFLNGCVSREGAGRGHYLGSLGKFDLAVSLGSGTSGL